MKPSSRILVAPLNWGLGHATRCIPIINHLLSRGIEVILASDGRALDLLRAEFPQLESHELPSYGVSYNTDNMVINLTLQIPKITRTVLRERKWIQEFISQNDLHAIISDNRFGLYTSKVPTVFITHQVEIPVPIKWLSRFCNGLNRRFINRFDDVWVPDFDGPENLTGAMSHGTPIDYKLTYLGSISRMKQLESKKRFDVCVVLSGPEPQRTRLEHLLLTQFAKLPYKVLLVRGIPKNLQRAICSDNLEMISFMKGEELNQAILDSELIISRSGYTTIMDLAVLGKKALFIPTPGQKEQEDLADHFREKNIYHSRTQDQVDLQTDIPKALKMNGLSISSKENEQMKNVVNEWLLIHNLGERKSPDQPLFKNPTNKKSKAK